MLLFLLLSSLAVLPVLGPGPGEDLERNDGSSSRPYYMSPGLHKILRKGEQGAKLCSGSWATCPALTELLTLSLTSPYMYVWGSGCAGASKYCRARHLNGAGLAWDDADMTGHVFGSSQKGRGGLEKELCSLPLLSQLWLLAFFPPCICSFLFFLFILCCSLPYWEGTCQHTGSMRRLKWI